MQHDSFWAGIVCLTAVGGRQQRKLAGPKISAKAPSGSQCAFAQPRRQPARRRPASIAGPIAPSISSLHSVRPEPRRDDKCNVSLNDAAARHRSTGVPHHFIIIMSIMACMSFTLTIPLLPFFILSYMDS